MPSLSIKNVPDAVIEKLRARAARNHRSLQGELLALVCQAAEPNVPLSRAAPAAEKGTKTIEQITAELRERWPEPFDEGPRAVDLIRAARDAR